MSRTRSVAFLSILLVVVLSGCSVLASDANKAAVEAGRKAGLQAYWLGDSFVVDGKKTELAADGTFYGPDNPQVSLNYWLDRGASGTADVSTYSEAHGGWQLYLEAARRMRTTSIVKTTVGGWSGELWIVPTPGRQVNAVIYVLHIDGMVVIATSNAASTGVPGTDVNPLIDAKLWRQVLEQHLQPYPK